MVRRKDHRTLEIAQVLAALDAQPRERAVSGITQMGKWIRRNARASGPASTWGVHRSTGAAVVRRRLLDEGPPLAEIARRRKRFPRRCASETRPRAPPSARRDPASSGRAPRASSPAVICAEPAYFATSADSASVPACTSRGVAPPVFAQSRIAARFSLRVPSVRGSSGSGHIRARRIL